MTLEIAEIPALGGTLALCPMPGRNGGYAADLETLLIWRPGLVLTMTSKLELATKGAATLPADLAAAGIDWRHLPVPDFGTPKADTAALWSDTSAQARAHLAQGGRVLAHCMGGCGRSGMAVLRLLADGGEDPDAALSRLRAARPCAVETKAQLRWASTR
ncbi:MAG: protein phosphatase [Pseudotabrizicola sp.]|uniref:phosphatase domain-containing putative toxin n=1 Tax=Pseudotabrizicola sp. TaxID=2939647 RepID=UPI002721BF2D|nr:protein-tyrosine phosphatase family protein [Pseudotabrizicola sp.]MDO8883933.1 protein phosphatase [Pseudotabrizicola sp.]MDP2082221.1 protein phosphatase [Pseudotabrizicola sp.]MDZ7575141.1 protein phosphatase [Pseudotabrizicola sp.]